MGKSMMYMLIEVYVRVGFFLQIFDKHILVLQWLNQKVNKTCFVCQHVHNTDSDLMLQSRLSPLMLLLKVHCKSQSVIRQV